MRQLFRRSRHLTLILLSAATFAAVAAPVAGADTNGSSGKMSPENCSILYGQYMNDVMDAGASILQANWGLAQTEISQAHNTRDDAASGGCAWAQTAPAPPTLVIPRVGGVTLAK